MTTRKIYKLTNQNGQTHGGYKFVEGEWTPELDGTGGLCSNTVYHSYSSPLLAVLLNPVNASFENPVLWEGEAKGAFISDGLKQGDGAQRLLARVALPEISAEQRVAFAILCSLEICAYPSYVAWASAWLDGSDRSAEAAARAVRSAAARAVRVKAARAAVLAVRAAVLAVRGAAWAAAAADAADAAAADRSAAWAAEAAGKKIDFAELAEKAMEY